MVRSGDWVSSSLRVLISERDIFGVAVNVLLCGTTRRVSIKSGPNYKIEEEQSEVKVFFPMSLLLFNEKKKNISTKLSRMCPD